MSSDAMAKNLRRWRIAVGTHDVENPTHKTHGIGVCAYDAERLGLEDGEELWTGIKLEVISCATGNFRVLCDGEHDEGPSGKEKEAEELVQTIADAYDVPRELIGDAPREGAFV